MMTQFYKILFLIIIFFSVFQTGTAQELQKDESAIEKVEIPKESIQQYKDNDDFNYVIVQEKENIFTRIWNWFKRQIKYILKKIFDWIFGVEVSSKYFVYFLKSLPYLALLLFIFIVYKFLLGLDLIRLKSSKNKRLSQVDLTDDERILQEENFDKLIAEALQNNNYRLAIRYQYLKVLKILINKSLINWKPEKTNRDYVREVRNTDYATSFRNLTFIYDYVWYGKFNPNMTEYQEIENDFNAFS